MKLGIIGLPQVGKTTIFNALTRGDYPVTMSGGRLKVHTAVIDVPDPRVDALSELYHPRKTTYAKVNYTDIAGLEGSSGGNISGALLAELAQMDGFIHVVRCFEDPSVPHVQGSVDPQRDIDTMEGEFILNDLIQVERRLERLDEDRQRNRGDKAEIAREEALFHKLSAHLSEELPLRVYDLTEDEVKAISGYGFLSMKPLLIIPNLGDDQESAEFDVPAESVVIPIRGSLEMEIAQLEPEDAKIFMDEYDIVEPSLHRMIRESYDLMNLQSFFTVGEDEVRAWTIRRGMTAPEAAGVIHSDLQKGFIRAEVVSCDDLLSHGSIPAARAKGLVRMEGKAYFPQDSDIMHVLFNV